MQVIYTVVSREVSMKMDFEKVVAMFVNAGECKGWNWSKLEEALEAGFDVQLPLGIEICKA
jgi:hypothetical protein